MKPPECLERSNFRESAPGLRMIIAKQRGGKYMYTLEQLQTCEGGAGGSAFPPALVPSSPHALSVPRRFILSSFTGALLLVCLHLLPRVLCCDPVASPCSGSKLQYIPCLDMESSNNLPPVFLIYSSLFSTPCCSRRCSKFFHLGCWALARENRGRTPSKLRLDHFKLPLQGHLFLFFPGM